MVILRLFKKIGIAIAIFVVIYAIFSIIFAYITKNVFIDYLTTLKSNLLNQSKFDTDYFIIDLPKFSWECISESTHIIAFSGISIYQNNTFAIPIVILSRFNAFPPDDPISVNAWLENDISAFEDNCNTTLVKTTHIIDDRELTAYDCFGEYQERYIIYKDAFFYLISYANDKFKPQYDKFFEGVRLKE
jgi:hypothetical protein